MRKAQTEILGLVFVVLLVSIGILIAFLIFSKPAGDDVMYAQESLFASDFLSVLLKTDSLCKGRSVGELVQLCAASSYGSSGLVCENGDGACFHAKSLISDLFEEVFTDKGKKFYFSIKSSEGNVVEGVSDFVFGIPCTGEFESKTRPLVYMGGTAYLKLDICY